MTHAITIENVTSLYWLARKWLIWDRPRLELHAAWIYGGSVAIAIALPVFIHILAMLVYRVSSMDGTVGFYW